MAIYYYRPDANKFAGVELLESDLQGHALLEERARPLNRPPKVTDIHYTEEPLLNNWVPPHVLLFEDNPPRTGDFPSLSNFWSVPVCSERAWKALQPLIGDVCEALPVQYPTGEPYFIIHVMRTIDCLDIEKSSVRINSVTGRVSNIYVHVFKEELLPGEHIFKLPLRSGGELFVDDVFRKTVEANRLKGLDFRPVIMPGTPEGDEMAKKVAKMQLKR